MRAGKWARAGICAAACAAWTALPAKGQFNRAFVLTPDGNGRYDATDIGTFGGADTWASKMNNLGQVVGASSTASGVHAFQWTPGEGMRDLGTLVNDPASLAYGVNDLGQVVGMSVPQNNSEPPFNGLGRPFLWTQAGGIEYLGVLAGAGAEDINAQGMVCGTIAKFPWSLQMFVWTASSGLRYIDTLGGELNIARAINDAGSVVGLSQLPNDGGAHACRWSASLGIVDLGTLPGDSVSSAEDINDSGHVVGWSRNLSADGTSRDRAVFWTQENVAQELIGFGAEAIALGINNGGLVVGACMGDDIGWHAAIWENGAVKDLNALVSGDLQCGLRYALGVNDSGQILAVFDGGLPFSCGCRFSCVENVTSSLLYCSIQTAIDAAVDDDEIVVHRGTYKESLNLQTKKITLTGTDPNDWSVVADTVIDGDVDGDPATLEGPTLTISGGQGRETVVSGLTITGGTGKLAHQFRCGGGVYVSDSSPTLTGLRIHSNEAHFGGGIYCEDAAPLIALNIIADNRAGFAGGGIELIASPGAEMVGNQILYNTATASAGGGIDVYDCGGTGPSIINNTVAGNQAPAYPGSGISSEAASTRIQNNIIFANENYGIATWDTTPVTILYNDLWNNANGPCWGFGSCGPTNLSVDPLFEDGDGPDNNPATWQDNSYRLSAVSPCIDAGDDSALPRDTQDLDNDGDTTEPIPFDLQRLPRFIGCMVDMGAYEVQNRAIAPVRWDLDHDGDVDQFDHVLWESCASGPGVPRQQSPLCQQADLDNDNDVDQSDFAIFQRCICGTNVPEVSAFAINSGAETTTSRIVTLNNTCLATPAVYMASESPDFTGATWEPYSTEPTFTLSVGKGTKTVYFKVRNPAESAPVSDTITLRLCILDFDEDGDVDTADLHTFESCASGPGIPHNGTPECLVADLDLDTDVDQADFALFQRCYSGENVPADADCAE